MRASWALSLWLPLQSLALLHMDSKKDPMSRVVSLLEDMEKQLEVDAKADEDVYDKMVCWCGETQKSKQSAIDEGTAKIQELAAEIEQGIALSSRLGPEIDSLKSEFEKNAAALKQAAAIREKQSTEFEEQSKDLAESISAVKKALKVMSKKETKESKESVSFLQTSKSSEVSSALREVFVRSRRFLDRVSSPDLPRHFREADLLQYFQPGQSSDEVYGMLSQMQDTFEQDLKEMQEEEASSKAAYEKLNDAKAEEIETSKSQLRLKQKEKASADEQLAHDKKEKNTVGKALEEDKKFLKAVQTKCANTDSEWDARQKTRREEVKAIASATQVLTENKPASFLQFSSQNLQTQAGKLLSRGSRSKFLAFRASHSKAGSLGEVLKAVDDMISELKKQKKGESEKKTFCKDQLTKNEVQQDKQDRKKEDVTILLETLTQKIKKTKAEKAELESEIENMNKEMAKAAQDREAQNKAFQLSVNDQRETQKLLKAALKVLSEFYSKSFVQLSEEKQTDEVARNEDEDGAVDDSFGAPQGFSDYKKNSASKGVLAMLEHILEQAQAAEKQAVKDENAAQSDYETLAKETTASVATKKKEVDSVEAAITKAEGERADAKTDGENILAAMKALTSAAGTLHSNCDFLVKNFQTRQTAMDDEIGGLIEAKAVMQGITGAANSES